MLKVGSKELTCDAIMLKLKLQNRTSTAHKIGIATGRLFLFFWFVKLSNKDTQIFIHVSDAHLKVLLYEVPSFAQTLHDGFVPQDVLLAQMLSPLPGLEHQAVHRVEIGQKVSHALLEINKQLDKFPPATD